MRISRIIQILSFSLFLFLLWLAAFPLPSWLPVDMFLWFDPLISLGTMLTARTIVPALMWALIILILTLFLGRFFCGYICPMGSTIDFFDWLIKKKKKRKQNDIIPVKYRFVKYILLCFVLGTALIGLSSVFLFSPLSIITRFYSFVIYPLILMTGNLILDILRPIAYFVGLEGMAYAYFSVPAFNTNLFTFLLVIFILCMGLIQPRFWCRNICPSGAIFALCSKKPILRRTVSDGCSQCGKCFRGCPMEAVTDDFTGTDHSECIACLKCRDICPENVIRFGNEKFENNLSPGFDFNKRQLLGGTLSGITAAAVTMTGLNHFQKHGDIRPLLSSKLIRPPGALPEPDFQARCVRCGECIKGCLTNTLQPIWFEAGLSGLFTPKVTARWAGCEQNCNICGHLCPTGAIRPLDMLDKKFAKIGTARIIKTRCIAWEQDKTCLICDEICPYNAISSQFLTDHPVTVPVINENRCNGCGYCETKCPIKGESAIVVEPSGELRMMSGSYEKKAKQLGLVFHSKTKVQDQFILDYSQIQKDNQKKTQQKNAESNKSTLPPGFITE